MKEALPLHAVREAGRGDLSRSARHPAVASGSALGLHVGGSPRPTLGARSSPASRRRQTRPAAGDAAWPRLLLCHGAVASSLGVGALRHRRQSRCRRATSCRVSKIDDVLSLLDADGDGRLSKDEISQGLRMLGSEDGLGSEELAEELVAEIDLDGDGFITIEEWEDTLQKRKFSAGVKQAVNDLELGTEQLKDILQYVFSQWDTDGDGEISYDEFKVALNLVGMPLPEEQSKRTFMMLSGGRDTIVQESSKGSAWMSGMQYALFDRWKNESLGKAEYMMNNVKNAWTKSGSDLNLIERSQKAVQAFWSQSDILPDLTESLADLVGMGFAILSLSNQLNCLPNCAEDGIDFTNLIPLVVLFRRTLNDSFKKIQDVLVDDLDQDKAVVFTMTFKPAGFSVVDFQHMYEQGLAEWRTLPTGMTFQEDAVGDKLQLIVRGSVKILNQSLVPGLSETSVILGPGTFLGAAKFMDSPEDNKGQAVGQTVSVMEDTLVLLWEVQSLRRYFQVNTGTKQQFRVMLARSIESTMWQVSQQAQKMAVELPLLFRDFILEVRLNCGADRATLWVYNKQTDMLWTLFVTEEGKTSYVCIDSSTGLAGSCFKSGRAVNIPDCYQDERFNKAVDKHTGYYTKSTLCVPVYNDTLDRVPHDERPIGVVQLVNKLVEDEEHMKAIRETATGEDLAQNFTSFTETDKFNAEKTLWLTALMVQQLSRRYNAAKVTSLD